MSRPMVRWMFLRTKSGTTIWHSIFYQFQNITDGLIRTTSVNRHGQGRKKKRKRMAIEQTSKSFTRKLPGGFWEEINPSRVICDHCGKAAAKQGNTPGDAADAARKDGFSLVHGRFLAPLKWACNGCKDTMDKEKTSGVRVRNS
jgi:hypothetical protein